MKRRTFVSRSIQAASMLPFLGFRAKEDLIIGHGSHRYKVDLNWGALNSNYYPVNDCHEMVQDSKGLIYLLTNETKNNVLVYNTSGKLIKTWGSTYPGAHGLTIKDEGGEEFLYITDNNRHQVFKTTLDGKEIMAIDFPQETGFYKSADQYVPTETAIADNGDIFVADGYGLQHIIQYDAKGNLLNVFGGKGDQVQNFGNAHGIVIDQRGGKEPQLLITDRMANQLKRFDMDGTYKSTIDLPGAYICRPVIKGEHIYLATIWSGDQAPGSGFISILNGDDELISAPGGSTPTYQDGKLNSMHQAIKLFHHPHDVCVDKDENLYVAQWNSGKTYPIKLVRV